MAYRVETKLRCLACGFGIIYENNESSVTCPKCNSKWALTREDGEIALEPIS